MREYFQNLTPRELCSPTPLHVVERGNIAAGCHPFKVDDKAQDMYESETLLLFYLGSDVFNSAK